MNKKKKGEKPQARFSASKNSSQYTGSEAKAAAPHNRKRDSKAQDVALESLKRAQNGSPERDYAPSTQSYANPVKTHQNTSQSLPDTFVEEQSAVEVKKSKINPFSSGARDVSIEVGAAFSAQEETESLAPLADPVEAPESRSKAVSEVESITPAPVASKPSYAPPVPVQRAPEALPATPELVAAVEEPKAIAQATVDDFEFVKYVKSPFQQKPESLDSETAKFDKVFSHFQAKEQEQSVELVDEEELEPLVIPKTERDTSDEDEDLLHFNRITPDTDEEPDFDALKTRLEAKTPSIRMKEASKIRRMVFGDMKRRGSSMLPQFRQSVKPVISEFTPERRLSHERYLKLYAAEAPMIERGTGSGPAYRRKLSPSLKKAILEDRFHPSELEQPESYDINAPLPELIPSDFIEEGVPNLLLEGGPSVQEVLAAKRAERRDADGGVKRDLASADFVEEAFGELFVDHAEKHGQTYAQLKAPVVFDSESDELFDWVPVFPPSAPASVDVQTPLKAGVVVGDVFDFDSELAHEDYIDQVFPDQPAPVAAQTVGRSYKDDYLDSLDPDLFLADFFSEDESDYVGAVEGSVLSPDEVLQGVPVRAEGGEIMNKAWSSYVLKTSALQGVSAAVVVGGAAMLAGNGLSLAPAAGVIGVVLFAVMLLIKKLRFKNFAVDYESQAVVIGSKGFRFSELVTGEGRSYKKPGILSPRTVSLYTRGGYELRVMVECGGFKLPKADVDALVELINQSGLPYSSDIDLEEMDEASRFSGTKRNLTMLANTAYMK